MSRSHVSANLLVRALAVVGVAGLAGCAGETRTPPLKLPERPGLSGVSGHSGAPAPRGAAQETGTEVAERDNEIWVDRERASSLPPVLASDRTRPPLPGGLESGGFRTVGGLLAEVNGRAIYSDDVIATLTPELRGLAKNYDYETYLDRARAALASETADRIRNEISRVIAERNLVARDRELARLVAMQWRTRQISAAGGSEARARQLAREETGSSLQALAEQTEARILGILFYQKNILPRATPSANEVRDYFRRHRDEFRVEGAIDFLLIELVRQSGESPDAFEARAARVHARAAAGEDFATLAGEVNDNPVYRQSNGRLPQMLQLTRPGQFRWAAVDAAAWSTPVGRITPVIPEDSGNRRFIARILEQQTPRVLGFDEAQEQITQILTFQRRQALLGELEADATRYAAVTPQEEIDRFLRTAVEVAAQNYQRWRND